MIMTFYSSVPQISVKVLCGPGGLYIEGGSVETPGLVLEMLKN